ncbi:hypothetical protein HPP92_024946 [Vanilla planifolia]|uniref:Uncharacterized protein n=1 Tax=Vanilla planifolia TaxID=51239 RepID=A0A835PF05_VANPL|nr:hypothetical protein HPP92_025234 [Vanilla planifolia]KAG0453642.1 hypothetical protein HPP92_024946 [Vanilla planifolia]
MGKGDGSDSVCSKLYNALTFRKEGPEAPPRAADANVSAKSQLVKIQNFDKQGPHQPATTAGQSTAEKPRRAYSINKKVDDFIARTKMKLRSSSAVGRHAD